MPLSSKIPPGGYEIVKEGREEIMRINCFRAPYPPSLERSALCMADTINKLIQVPSVTRIVFFERRHYSYNYVQTQMLVEIAYVYNLLITEKKVLRPSSLISPFASTADLSRRHGIMQYIVFNLLKSDPIGAYVETKRILREEKIRLGKVIDPREKESEEKFIGMLEYIKAILGKTSLIKKVKEHLAGYELGDRTLYTSVFRPEITPDFMITRLMIQPPLTGEELDVYSVGNNNIVIYSIAGDIKLLYHIIPPEFKLTEDKYALLDLARTVVAEHKPREEEFLDPERIRETFFNISRDLLRELAESRHIHLEANELEEMAKILVRYTIGFGMVEVLLQDPKIQDININGPIGETPIFIIHEDYGQCVTNIVPSKEDAESWATKFRIISGRPLDEANPVLDTELLLPGVRNRVAIIQQPLSPVGLAFALRRHRAKPWTYPLFIKNRMISPMAAGLLSFLIDGARTLIFAGTRSSGKTSLLGSSLVEIMRRYRIITIEDTREISVEKLRDLGYNIQPMKVRSALMTGGTELAADEGIRTSLRMGDSSLIVGEVRSQEALALFEAMRIGALANVVAGTIHGDSPYGVFDRLVNDLKVPPTSFKAADIIIISNPIKSPDGLHMWRRVLSITEVRKHWVKDPLREKGFVDLMRYNSKTDTLEPTDDLINGDSEVLKKVAENVKDWAGNWDAVWSNILLRTKMKETLVNYADKLKRDDILEAEFVVPANDQFHKISEKIKETTGELDNKKIFFEWEDWLKRKIKEK